MPGAFNDTSGILEAVAVTPSDTVDIWASPDVPARGLYVGVSGDVKVQPLEGAAVTLGNLAAGVWHPFVFRRVYATGTTATGILAGR